jgi:hypothetical protein
MGYENVPMIAAFDQDDFYASFVMFGDRISSEAAEPCAAVDGIYKEPEGTDVGGEEEDVPVNDIDTDEECEGGIGGAIAEDDVSFLAPQGDIVEEFSDEDQSDIEFSDDDVAIEEKDGGWVDDGQVECVFVCPEGMIAWIWYGEYGEKFADGKLTWKSSEKEICERGFPWVDFNCAAPDWTTFDPSLAVIECNQSFVRHSGVIDFNGEGELFFKDFVCYQWKPPVAKACGKYCIALSAYYLFRADSAYVVGDLSGAGEDLAAAKKIQIADDEYYHFEFGESAPGLYHLQYATINQEFAYFDGDWISVVVDVAGNTATSIE